MATASWPLSAVPATATSGSSPSSMASPSLTIRWSSVTSTRIGPVMPARSRRPAGFRARDVAV